jgi:hypothetical protein
MSAAMHPSITLDLASSTIGDLHRSARDRAQRATARRTRPGRKSGQVAAR